jgi:hypothetical protein
MRPPINIEVTSTKSGWNRVRYTSVKPVIAPEIPSFVSVNAPLTPVISFTPKVELGETVSAGVNEEIVLEGR